MKFALSLILSLAIGGGLLVVAAWGLELDAVAGHFADADPVNLGLAIAGYLALFSVVHALRLWRWAFLLRTVGTPSAAAVWRAGAVGFAAILLLPLRLGELARPYVISRESECSFSASLGTVAVERVVDGLAITLLLFLTLATYRGTGSTAFATGVGYIALAIFVSALLVCAAALWKRDLTTSLTKRVLGILSARLADKLTGLLETFLDGVRALRDRNSLLPFLAVTAAYWGVNGVSIAFLANVGFGLDVGPWDGMTMLAILVVGIMVPAGPALAGNYEIFALEGLSLFESPERVAVAGAAFVATIHICQFIVQVAPGLWIQWASAARGRYSFFRMVEQADALTSAAEASPSDESGAPPAASGT